jgi:glycine/D-amino acid oxidase-like deaminating enzyme
MSFPPEGKRSFDGYSRRPLWLDTARIPAVPRPSLADVEPAGRVVDVAIVGAGYTGLWAAYYLHLADPGLRIAVLEQETVGFGASGRNGGWCSGLYPVSLTKLATEHGRDQAVRQYRAMHDTVAEVEHVITQRNWPVDLFTGGTVSLARSDPQLDRVRHEVAEARSFGFAEDDLRLLTAAEASSQLRATGVLGGVFSRHCAAVQPVDLVRSIASEVAASAAIYENSAATSIEPGRVRTVHGDLRADVVIRATEGFTPSLPGQRRTLAPVYSLMISSEPIAAERWQQLGLEHHQTFSDLRHLIIYGQRTADDRIAFGGRGAPYHLRSRVRPGFDQNARVFALLRRTILELLPDLADIRWTNCWGGPLGIARDWHPSVGFDPTTGIGWAGGYVGDGVSTANLAGRTLADLILRRDTDLTTLPWVNHRSPQWEREPLRWLGANAGLRAMTWADRAEARHGTPSRLARVVNKAVGR